MRYQVVEQFLICKLINIHMPITIIYIVLQLHLQLVLQLHLQLFLQLHLQLFLQLHLQLHFLL